MNISKTIQPKSDQLNADDCLAAPMTITVANVTKGTPEQPINIEWQGGDGRPYKPSKSMRRVIATAWGVESSAYVGRRMTLYCDPSVIYAGKAVGGLRISHMSDIAAPINIALTITRGKREMHTVTPLLERDYNSEGARAATNGIDSLREWWVSVPKSDQSNLKETLEKLKKSIQ